jgi:hypothetical protein
MIQWLVTKWYLWRALGFRGMLAAKALSADDIQALLNALMQDMEDC